MSGQMYHRTLTAKIVNALNGQMRPRKYKHFLRGAVLDTHYSTINNSLITSLEQPEAESGVSKYFSSEAHSIRPRTQQFLVAVVL